MASVLILILFSLGVIFLQNNVSVLFVLAPIFILLVFFLFKKLYKQLFFVLILTCLFGVGFTRAFIAEEKFNNIKFLKENSIVSIVQSVEQRNSNTLIYSKTKEDAKILVRSFQKENILPGDEIVSTGNIVLPEEFVTDTGRIFDYPNYLKSKGVSSTQEAKSVEIKKEGKGIMRFFAKLNRGTERLLSRSVSYPIDGITGGMVLGNRGSIPNEITEIFQRTGTLHLLVLSGYNITLLLTFLILFLKRAPFYLRTTLLILGVISLVVLSGAGIAAVRAGAMALVALLGQILGRQYLAVRALGIVFFILVFINPYLLLYDPGFQLSFLATLCMVSIVPFVGKFFKKVPEKFLKLPIRETLSITITVSLFMLPYVAYFSGQISILTIPANFLSAFFVPTITLLGILVILFSSIIPTVGIFFGGILGFFGKILLSILELASRIPNIEIPTFSWFWVLLIYSIIFFILFRKNLFSSFSK